jgi:iron complex transport system permease protein
MGDVISKPAEPRIRKDLKGEYKRHLFTKVLFIVACILVILLLAGISATMGSYTIGIIDVYHIIWDGLFTPPEGAEAIVVWNLRLPRILIGILAGAGLAMAGAVMQGILRNPLGDPFTLGISSGASFGAALAILLGAGLVGGKYLIIGNAFVFSLIPTFIVVMLTLYRKASPETLILAGVAMMYLFSAATTLMMFLASPDAMKEAYFWMIGSLGKVSWEAIMPVSVVFLVCMIPIMWKSKDLNIMAGGDETAKSLGIKVERTRLVMMGIASLVAASIVAFTGPIGFIGLVAPHICRMVIGGDNRFLIPASAAAGAILLLASDTIARTIIAPVILPVGIVTDFLGAPLFIYLIMRRKKEYW